MAVSKKKAATKKKAAKKKAVRKKRPPKDADEKTVVAFDMVAAGFPEEAPTQGLLPQQIEFVDQLILLKGNRPGAYKAAGYQVKDDMVARKAADRLLKNVGIQRLLAFRLEQLRKLAKIEARQVEVVRELNRIAYSDLSDVLRWDENGNVTVISANDLPKDVTAAVKKFKHKRTVITTKDGNEIETNEIEVEMHSKQGALDILSRATKLVGNTERAPRRVSLRFDLGGGGRRPVTIDVDADG